MTQKYAAPALEKGLDILEHLAAQNGPTSQKQIAGALQRTPSEIFRMLNTLVERGFVIKGEDERYSLSLRMFSLSQRLPPLERLLAFAEPKMNELVNECWQSCHIGIEDAGNIVILASAPSPGNWALSLRPGAVIGLTNTSTGRTLAAFRTEEQARQLFQTRTLAVGEPKGDLSAFLSRMAIIRSDGEEITPSDTTEGVTNMAFPVFDHSGRAIAVVNCPYLKRLDGLEVPSKDTVADKFRQFAAALTAYYGGYAPEKLAP